MSLVTIPDNHTTVATRSVFHHSVVFAGGDYCYDLSFRTKRWCPYGCCGSMDVNCCDANLALIVGLTVFCGLVALSIVICVVCCLRRGKGATGSVINPNPTPLAHVITSGTGHATVTAMGQPMTYSVPGPVVTRVYQSSYYTPPAPQPPQQPLSYTATQQMPQQYSTSPANCKSPV